MNSKIKYVIISLIIMMILIGVICFTKNRKNNDNITDGNFDIEESKSQEYTDSSNEKLDELTSKIAEEYSSQISELEQNTKINSAGDIEYYNDFMDSDIENLDIDEITDYALNHIDLLDTDMPDSILKNMIIYAIGNFTVDTCKFICNNEDISPVKEAFIYKCKIHNESESFELLVDVSNLKIKFVK